MLVENPSNSLEWMIFLAQKYASMFIKGTWLTLEIAGSIVIRDSRFVNEFHILKATCKFCTRLSTFVMTFPFFPLLL